MIKIKKIVSIMLAFVICIGGTLSVSAKENAVCDDAEMIVYKVSYIIYDENGNITETGNLPVNEEAAMTRDYWGSRTISPGGYMTLNSQDTGFPYFLVEGARVQMEFGLDRNAVIASGIKSNSGIYLASYRGLTGGRTHSAIVTQTGNYQGYIRNDDSSSITVTYASFSTNR